MRQSLHLSCSRIGSCKHQWMQAELPAAAQGLVSVRPETATQAACQQGAPELALSCLRIKHSPAELERACRATWLEHKTAGTAWPPPPCTLPASAAFTWTRLTAIFPCRVPPAPAKRSALALLCEAGVDIAALVVAHLRLHDFAALTCCSTGLRTLVADLPEACWREAARRDLPAEHPVQRTTDGVRRFLHTQHRAHAAIESGQGWSQTRKAPAGVVSPCLSLSAVCRNSNTVLSVHSYTTGQQMHSWPLPALLPGEDFVYSRQFWSPDSKVVALGFTRAISPTLYILTSIVLVHVQSGRQVVASLASAAGPTAKLHDWSATGLLLVTWTCVQRQTHVAAYNAAGVRHAQISLPVAEESWLAHAWSPDGCAVALRCDSLSLWVWKLSDGCHRVCAGSTIGDMAWAPSSGAVLLLTWSGIGLHVYLWDLHTQTLVRQLAEFISDIFCGVAWGSEAIAVLCELGVQGYKQLLLCDMAPDLQVRHTVKVGAGREFSKYVIGLQPALCSPDGRYCIFRIESSGDEPAARHYELLVVNLGSGTQHRYPVSCKPWRCAWAPDSSAVLLELTEGGSLLLSFV